MPIHRSTHLYFWLAYLLVFTINSAFFPSPSDSHLPGWLLLGRGLIFQGIRVLPVLLVAYGFVWKILPEIIYKRDYSKALLYAMPLLLVAVFLTRILLGYAIYPLLYQEVPNFALFSLPRLFYSFIDVLSSSMIFIAFYVIVSQLQQAKEKEQIKNAQLEMELKFLQSQVHPHFLFNTLNNLYAMARKNSAHTASSIAKLSQIFRFMLYKSGQENILLEEELDLIQDYIELEKLRYNERLQLKYQESLDDHRQVIGPLLLLPLVENAFKHGASETMDQININISVVLKEQQFRFQIDNSLEVNKISSRVGIGLNNLRRQLQLQYPQKHQLDIEQENTYYKVDLKIDFS